MESRENAKGNGKKPPAQTRHKLLGKEALTVNQGLAVGSRAVPQVRETEQKGQEVRWSAWQRHDLGRMGAPPSRLSAHSRPLAMCSRKANLQRLRDHLLDLRTTRVVERNRDIKEPENQSPTAVPC